MCYSHSNNGRLCDAMLQIFGGESPGGSALLFLLSIYVEPSFWLISARIECASAHRTVWPYFLCSFQYDFRLKRCSYEMRRTFHLRMAS
jgi:hypothetical protein